MNWVIRVALSLLNYLRKKRVDEIETQIQENETPAPYKLEPRE